jgi:hypothetical protein
LGSLKTLGHVAKLTTGVAAAFASIWFPVSAPLVGVALNFAIAKFVKRPTNWLIEELKAGNVGVLKDEAAAEFVPMAYRFLEAAKEGEYEHNLRVLGSYIAQELKQEKPEASNVARMARRIEGLSKRDLRTIALVAAAGGTGMPGAKITASYLAAFVHEQVRSESKSELNPWFHVYDPQSLRSDPRAVFDEPLAELASRGLLLADPAVRTGHTEEYYSPTDNFRELIEKARGAIERIAAESESESESASEGCR